MTRTKDIDTSYQFETEESTVTPLSFEQIEMIGGGAMVVNAE